MTDLILQDQWQIDRGESPTNLARFVLDGALLTAGDLDGVTLAIYELADDDPAARELVGEEPTELLPADVVLSPAVTGDERWPYAAGYNFRHQASWEQVSGRLYALEYTFTPVIGQPLVRVFRYRVL